MIGAAGHQSLPTYGYIQKAFAALKRSGTWRVIIFVSLAFRLEAIALSGHFSG